MKKICLCSSGPRPFGVSSSDEEIRSTPECTSCGEEEMESESVSEKGRPPFISGSHFSFFSLFLGTYLFTWNTTLSLLKGVFTKY